MERQDMLISFLKNRFGEQISEEDCSNIRSVSDYDLLKSAIEVILNAKTKEEVLNLLKK